MTMREVAVAMGGAAEQICATLLPAGKRNGRIWQCGDVTGSPGDSMAVELDGPKSGFWFDHAAGAGGDMIDLVAQRLSISKGKACQWGKDFLGIKSETNGHSDPAEFDPLKFRWKHGELWITGSRAWTYRDTSGSIIGYVVRFDFGDGKKDIIPCRQVDGKWKWKGWTGDEKRPIYNVHKLAENPNLPVLVVEGEKTADAAAKLFPSHVVVTCQGGCRSFPKADWDCLKSRQLFLWPDADSNGRAAMVYLKSRFPDAKLVDTSMLPDGWDLADPIPEGIDVTGMLHRASDPKPVSAPAAAPYRCLGHHENRFYYMSHKARYVICLSAKEHTELGLQALASDQHWLDHGFYEAKSNDVDYMAVAKHLIDQSFKVGMYDPTRIRGLGCWVDGQSIVYHAGDHLIVDGRRIELLDHKSRYIYPNRPPVDVCVDSVASVESLKPLTELFDLLPWATAGDGWKLGACCFLGSICGALDFRPNPWLIGPSGCGKSYTLGQIVVPLLGYCLNVKGETTASGIRQTLKNDALPTAFDEIEAKDQPSSRRVAVVMELMRSSSSETGGMIIKGGSDGHAQEFNTRSSFFFSSIALGAIETADENRVVPLEFRKRSGGDEFQKILQLVQTTTGDPEFCRRFVARAIIYAGRIRSAAALFGSAIQVACGDARRAQQYGTLAAAYWYLTKDTDPTTHDAEYTATHNQWDVPETPQESVSERATEVLLQSKIEVLDKDGHPSRLNIGEVLDLYYECVNSEDRRAAAAALMRAGIHPVFENGPKIDIALRHPELRRIFADTPFADRWSGYFKRLEGAEYSVFTPSGSKSIRAVRVSKSSMMTVSQPELPG